MAEITGRWKNQYAHEARRPKVAGLYLELVHPKCPMWRVKTGGSGNILVKRFGFAGYGSGAAAYRAAMEFLIGIGRLQSGKTWTRKSRDANRPDLPVGVCFCRKTGYGAFICVKGKTISKRFSIKKYGEEQAKAMAISQRRSWEEEFALKPERPIVAPIQPYEIQYEVVQI